jgi:hypothetical protein
MAAQLLTVTAARMIPAAVTGARIYPPCVLIDAIGPRGGAREFTVLFARDGSIRLAVETSPATVVIPPAALDPTVRAAAQRCYDQESNR